MTERSSRRQFLAAGAAAGCGFWLGSSLAPLRAASPNEKLNVAFIGIGGQGRANLSGIARPDVNVVALCDVDDQRAGKAYEQFPGARKYDDFRRMFDELESKIDAVVVSTPDHTHFHPSLMAIQMGKHLYCEKPLAHSVGEVRKLTEAARQKKVATQLGVQRHTLGAVHRAVELIQAGAIGTVRECHAWVGGDRGMPEIPRDTPPVPAHLNWDLWLGPAQPRPYHPTYAPYGWRFWWDFGTGEMGNWGCHILDIAYWALGLTQPTRVDASGPPPHPQTTPKAMATRFAFPAVGDRPAVELHWYHAKNGPPILSEHKLPHAGFNTLFVGSDGMLLCGFDRFRLLPEEKFRDSSMPAQTIPNSPGFHREWINACRGGAPATCNFQYSGPLTETVLLGNVAYRAGGGFNWDAAQLKAEGNPEAEQYIQPVFRDGWDV